jgi:hypothetical protein
LIIEVASTVFVIAKHILACAIIIPNPSYSFVRIIHSDVIRTTRPSAALELVQREGRVPLALVVVAALVAGFVDKSQQ